MLLELEQACSPEIQSSTEWKRVDQYAPLLDIEAAENSKKTLGKYALANQLEINLDQQVVNSDNTLLSAIQRAAMGDEDSRHLVQINVATDYSERLYKSKNEIVVKFDVINNQLYQNGRKNTSIQENVFKYGELNKNMFSRSEIEYKNAELFDLLIQQGVTEDFEILVASSTPTDQETRDKYNWFTDTDSMSLQLLSVDGSKATLESAFVAGKTTPSGPRHDMNAIKQVAFENGVDILDASEDDLVQYMMLIPKGSLELGVTSIVEQYDEAAGGTFYGEDEPQQDYQEFSRMCRSRNFNHEVEEIVEKLISSAHLIKSPQSAIELLDKLSGEQGVEEAIVNSDINPAIFGKEAKLSIEKARIAFEQNQFQMVNLHLTQAKKVQKSSSCPFATKENETLDSVLAKDLGLDINTKTQDEDKYGSLYFDCPKGHRNKRPRNTLIEKCQKCGCKVRC